MGRRSTHWVFTPFSIRFPWLQAQTFRQSLVLHADEHGRNQATEPNRIEIWSWRQKLGRFCLFETFPNANPENNLLGPWLNFKLFGITYLVGKVKFKLLFQGPLAKWDLKKHTTTRLLWICENSIDPVQHQSRFPPEPYPTVKALGSRKPWWVTSLLGWVFLHPVVRLVWGRSCNRRSRRGSWIWMFPKMVVPPNHPF